MRHTRARLALLITLFFAVAPAAHAAVFPLGTQLISRASDGGLPNAPSTNAVISGDKRLARVIAYQSQATNITAGTAGVMNVFAVLRGGSFGDDGSPWTPGQTVLISRTFSGQPANGASFAPTLDGAFHHGASCLAFLSAASNLVRHDTNGKVDAFLSRGPGGLPQRVSVRPHGRQSRRDTTAVAVSGDCKMVAFVAGGRLYVRRGRRTVVIKTHGAASHPSFSAGVGDDLVFAASGGVYFAPNGVGRPRLVAPGGSNPTMNGAGTKTIAYEKALGGHLQIFTRRLHGPEQLVTTFQGQPGNGDSRDPVITNAGTFTVFETDASNLNTHKAQADSNGLADAYIWLQPLGFTQVESVDDTQNGHQLPGGGQHPDINYYANYLVFDSPAPLGATTGPHEVYMRYRGGI